MVKIILVAALIVMAGCSPVLSQGVIENSNRDITPQSLLKDPDSYRGKIVILGGVIASSINTHEGTYIEVVQKPLDSRYRPENTDISYGRFLILSADYLDTAIYAQGREITVAGEVIGKKYVHWARLNIHIC